jgi:hypothetical protein
MAVMPAFALRASARQARERKKGGGTLVPPPSNSA